MAAVRDGRINIVPKTWEKTFFNWMENIQPWCVSRQLWWGHRIPAWYGPIIDDGGMKGNFSDSMRNRVFVAHDHDEMVEQFHEYYGADRSEEHTSELQSLMRISYAVFCLKKKKKKIYNTYKNRNTTN